MDKKCISFSKRENVVVKFGEEEIEIIPYIDINLQSTLINEYCKAYFDPTNKLIEKMSGDYFGAEYGIRMEVIDRLTNVSLVTEDGKTDVDYATVLSSGLWEVIVKEISNYGEFRQNLFYIVKSIEKEREILMSIGVTIDSFAKKIGEFLDKLNSFSPEEVKSLGEQGSKLLKEIEESPASEIFREAKKVPKSQKVQ